MDNNTSLYFFFTKRELFQCIYACPDPENVVKTPLLLGLDAELARFVDYLVQKNTDLDFGDLCGEAHMLLERHRDAREQANACNDRILTRFPAEIVGQIFRLVAFPSVDTFNGKMDAGSMSMSSKPNASLSLVLKLCRVSRGWRRTALDFGCLWSRLSLDHSNTGTRDRFRYAALFLERSRGAALDLTLSFPREMFPAPESVLDAVCKNSDRIQTLCVNAHIRVLERLYVRLPVTATLVLQASYGNDYQRRLGLRIAACPQNLRIHYHLFRMSDDLDLSHLTYLWISGITMHAFCDVLAQVPTLRRCAAWISSGPGARRVCTHAGLEELRLYQCYRLPPFDFSCVPRLERVFLGNSVKIVPRSCPNTLKELGLDQVSEDVFERFSGNEGIVHFLIESYCFANACQALLVLLYPSNPCSKSFVSQLQSIQFEFRPSAQSSSGSDRFLLMISDLLTHHLPCLKEFRVCIPFEAAWDEHVMDRVSSRSKEIFFDGSSFRIQTQKSVV